MRKSWLLPPLLVAFAQAGMAAAETVTVEARPVTEWKAVYGRVEARDRVPARARIGGTVESLDVTEGDKVQAGQRVAIVEDDKLKFRLGAIDAQMEALKAQLETARSDLERGKKLIERGVITSQRLDQLQTNVDVIEGQISSLRSERLVVVQQIAEGEILAPDSGVVLSVPISRGSVLAPGEVAAVIAGGGVYLRLAVPERHAGSLKENAVIQVGGGSDDPNARRAGRLAKLYPLIEGGRLQADVDVPGLDGRFIGRRVPVRLPVGEREAIFLPEAAIGREGGLDIVTVIEPSGEAVSRVVVPGGREMRDGEVWREILTGLEPGEKVRTPHE